jgi:hypothetical protein
MKFLTIFVALFLMPGLHIVAQEADHDDHGHQHDHHRYELGMANSLAYLGEDGAFSYGLHLHLVRNIGESRFGAGIGYERIFDEHKHNTVSVVGSFRATRGLVFNLSPGVAFEDEEPDHLGFAMHIEATYEFEVGKLHIGPLAEYAFDAEDYHISLGLHLGVGF